MNIQSKSSSHWTDDQLIAHLYAVGPEDQTHLGICPQCEARLLSMKSLGDSQAADEVDSKFLAAQRRRIYERLAVSENWMSAIPWRRWASAGAIAAVLGGTMLWYQEHETQQLYISGLSDAQLAQDVSSMSQSSEAQPTAPLQALFEE